MLLLGLLPAALTMGLAACSHPTGKEATATGTSTTRNTPVAVSDHEAEIAADQQALKAALPAPSDIKWGSSGFTTGTDTPDGWQVQNQHDSVSQTVATTGSRQMQIVCAGKGTLRVSITVHTADGVEATQPTTSASCRPEAATSSASFSLAQGDQGVDVVITPETDTVAAAGYTIT